MHCCLQASRREKDVDSENEFWVFSLQRPIFGFRSTSFFFKSTSIKKKDVDLSQIRVFANTLLHVGSMDLGNINLSSGRISTAATNWIACRRGFLLRRYILALMVTVASAQSPCSKPNVVASTCVCGGVTYDLSKMLSKDGIIACFRLICLLAAL